MPASGTFGRTHRIEFLNAVVIFRVVLIQAPAERKGQRDRSISEVPPNQVAVGFRGGNEV
ncbi:hypothetical protein RB7116 [Rhodopirellula baltica SH 1]|uniref:Uncharacterized protein n=1 Tax=Rhodopirellula baltica (strain DSM 10527 / NCIMB 13988 / SH1) TaxID=243090 RepID=Q7UP73_RHOBA|nr:hypothetical protein RB7116 [Rhodopirellula baltica SH 1]